MQTRAKGRSFQGAHSEGEPLVSLTALVPRSLLKRVRLFCFEQARQMQDFVAEAFTEYLRRQLHPQPAPHEHRRR